MLGVVGGCSSHSFLEKKMDVNQIFLCADSTGEIRITLQYYVGNTSVLIDGINYKQFKLNTVEEDIDGYLRMEDSVLFFLSKDFSVFQENNNPFIAQLGDEQILLDFRNELVGRVYGAGFIDNVVVIGISSEGNVFMFKCEPITKPMSHISNMTELYFSYTKGLQLFKLEDPIYGVCECGSASN